MKKIGKGVNREVNIKKERVRVRKKERKREGRKKENVQ